VRVLRNLKTGKKLLIAFGIVEIMMIALGAFSLVQLHAAQHRVDDLNVAMDLNDALSECDQDLTDAMKLELDHLIASSPEDMSAIESDLQAADAAYDESWTTYTTGKNHGDKNAISSVAALVTQWREIRDQKLLPLSRAHKSAEFVKVLNAEAVPLEDQLGGLYDKLRSRESDGANGVVTDALSSYHQVRNLTYGVLLIAVLLGLALAVFIGRLISRPLQQTVDILDGLAEGDLTRTLDIDSTDEVGVMATRLNHALTRLRTTMADISGNAHTLGASAEELSAVSSEMTGSATESSTQAGYVSAAAEQVSRNVQVVATGTDEMSASIREIARSAADAAATAAQAVGVADQANVTVSKLGDSSAEIGNVIKVISSIAEQTNLLALNATIEAARAGEAGKGFAVVANEVKELAQETSKATEDITRRIEAIQADTGDAVTAIAEISTIIAAIHDSQSTIASAVEEQTATTNEMSRNVAEAATGSNEIAQNISGVARAADETTTGAGNTAAAADELARMASDLQRVVGQFRF